MKSSPGCAEKPGDPSNFGIVKFYFKNGCKESQNNVLTKTRIINPPIRASPGKYPVLLPSGSACHTSRPPLLLTWTFHSPQTRSYLNKDVPLSYLEKTENASHSRCTL